MASASIRTYSLDNRQIWCSSIIVYEREIGRMYSNETGQVHRLTVVVDTFTNWQSVSVMHCKKCIFTVLFESLLIVVATCIHTNVIFFRTRSIHGSHGTHWLTYTLHHPTDCYSTRYRKSLHTNIFISIQIFLIQRARYRRRFHAYVFHAFQVLKNGHIDIDK